MQQCNWKQGRARNEVLTVTGTLAGTRDHDNHVEESTKEYSILYMKSSIFMRVFFCCGFG